MPTVRTRFAPSPTGYMHIGGMRTALFSWLFARHHGGTFVLRIDDTDRQRNVEEALGPILRAFRWLGLDWDEGPEVGGDFGPYFQSQRFDLYRAAAERLLAEGQAYRDYETPDEIKTQREAAQREGTQYLSSRRDAGLSAAERARLESEGRAGVVRFLVPREQKVVIEDAVRGRVEWDCATMPDPVILRGDGSPLYNFATVVDDAQMQITHVIRAEEHLSNTPVQALIYHALGAVLPQFAHVPYVAAPGSKEKLSKRKIAQYRKNPQFQRMFADADRIFSRIGLDPAAVELQPVMVEYYERIGFLPEGVLNALSRLGWSLDDKTEILPLPTVVENFTLDRVVKSAAGLDPDKLYSFQQHWMSQLPLDQRIDGCLPYLVAAGLIGQDEIGGQKSEVRSQESEVGAGNVNHGQRTTDDGPQPTHHSPLTTHPVSPATRAHVGHVIGAMGERLTLFSDVLNFDEFFLPDNRLPYDEKAFDKRLRAPGAADRLRRFREQLATVEPFEPTRLEELMKFFAESEGIKLADIIHPVRIATTGKSTGVGMFDALGLLGRDRCLRRLDRALDRV